MPTYEYACRECDHEFEIFQSMKAESMTRCPECDRETLHRLIGRGAGIIFKGSGFYETDYRRDTSSASASEKKSGEESSGEKSPSEKSSSKEKPAKESSSSSEGKTPSSTAPTNS